jgi:hypothetical protein
MTPLLRLLFLECFRVNEVVDVRIRFIVRGGGSGVTAGVSAKELEGTTPTTLAALFVLVTLDLQVFDNLEALAAPLLWLLRGEEALTRPVTLAVAMPAVRVLPRAPERKMVVRLTAETQLAILILPRFLG